MMIKSIADINKIRESKQADLMIRVNPDASPTKGAFSIFSASLSPARSLRTGVPFMMWLSKISFTSSGCTSVYMI